MSDLIDLAKFLVAQHYFCKCMAITSPLSINKSQDQINMKKLKHVEGLKDFKKNVKSFYKNKKLNISL